MARILINMPSQWGNVPSGVARLCFALLGSFLASGRHHYVLRSPWRREDLPPVLARSELEVVTVTRWRWMILNVFYQCVAMPLRTRRSRIDLVLNMDPFGTATGAHGRRVTILHDLYLHAIRDQYGGRSAFTSDICYRLTLGGSARIVAVSDATHHDALRFYSSLATRITTIHSDSTLAADPETTRPRELAEPYVLIVGNATGNKNYAMVVAALARLPAVERPVLAHVGRDLEGAVALAAAAVPGLVYRNVTDVNDERLAGFYQHALCLVVSSVYEGFCLPIVEAQAMGCPVVSSNRSVMPEIAGEAALFLILTMPVRSRLRSRGS